VASSSAASCSSSASSLLSAARLRRTRPRADMYASATKPIDPSAIAAPHLKLGE
jgi:hypothetical protein